MTWSLCLLLQFAAQRLGKVPSKLSLEELDAPFVGEFLDHLEKERGVAARSRTTRLAAIHSFFQYVSFQEPTRTDQCRRVLAIPRKRYGECPAERATPAFPSSRGGPLSRDAVERLVARHQRSPEERCPSLKRKRVTPHVLRHTAAMQLLRHGLDRSVIALWLGHESVEATQIYLHADLRRKEEALAKVTPLDMPPGRFRPDDELLALLEGL